MYKLQFVDYMYTRKIRYENMVWRKLFFPAGSAHTTCILGWSEKIKNDEIEKTAGLDSWQMVQNWLLKWFSWAAVKIELALQD